MTYDDWRNEIVHELRKRGFQPSEAEQEILLNL